jgi:hypothetical protein
MEFCSGRRVVAHVLYPALLIETCSKALDDRGVPSHRLLLHRIHGQLS